jgi:hypothetical protein
MLDSIQLGSPDRIRRDAKREIPKIHLVRCYIFAEDAFKGQTGAGLSRGGVIFPLSVSVKSPPLHPTHTQAPKPIVRPSPPDLLQQCRRARVGNSAKAIPFPSANGRILRCAQTTLFSNAVLSAAPSNTRTDLFVFMFALKTWDLQNRRRIAQPFLTNTCNSLILL